MDLFSYQLGKKAGGGGSPATLIDKNISANGTYNASQDSADGYKKVVVNVEPNLQDKEVTITSNTTTTISADSGYDGLGEVEVITNVPVPQQPTLIEKTITQNGTYDAEDDNADGYSSVTVETSGVDINDYYNTEIDTSSTSYSYTGPGFAQLNMMKKTPAFTVNSSVTDLTACFANIRSKINIDVSRMNTENVTTMSGMFYYCDRIVQLDISNFDVSKVTNFSSMFSNAQRLETLALPSFNNQPNSNINYDNMFNSAASIKNLTCSFNFKNAQANNMFYLTRALAILDLSEASSLEECSTFGTMFTSCGSNTWVSNGAYANGIPYVYVKDAAAQNWVLTANNGHPSTWTTDNVVIKNT